MYTVTIIVKVPDNADCPQASLARLLMLAVQNYNNHNEMSGSDKDGSFLITEDTTED